MLQPERDAPAQAIVPQGPREPQQQHWLVSMQSNSAGRLKLPWLSRGLRKGLIVGAALLLTGATIMMFLRQPAVPASTSTPPEPPPVVASPALAYQALEHGNRSQAESVFQRLAQEGEPHGQSQGFAGLAAVALARGDSQQALDFAARAEALDPEVVYSHVIRGHILWNQGRIGAAKTAYRTATNKLNGLPWQQAVAANRLGRIYAAEGFPGTALQYYDRAINQSPQMGLTYVNKAHLLEQLGRRQEALELYRQAAQMDPHDRLAGALLRQAERQERLAQDTQLAQRVAILVSTHPAGRPPEKAGDDWTSTPLTLAFLGVQRLGALAPEAGEEAFLSGTMAQALQDSGRIRLLDQALLPALLGELRRSAAELADAQVALEVSRVLDARLLASGSITHVGTADMLSISLIETATGAVRAHADAPWAPDTFSSHVQQLVDALLHQVRQAYPVRGHFGSTWHGLAWANSRLR
jgi:tetratricopeptide (TPR) repeat protein